MYLYLPQCRVLLIHTPKGKVMAGDEKKTLSERSADHDDLTCIRGLNPKIANRLYNVGILTFAKLAAMSPEDVISRIGPSGGVSVETITKRDWIGQAASLSEAKNKSLRSEATALQAVSYVIELFVDEKKQVQKTRIYHVQSNEDEDWQNWEESRLLTFFRKRPELALPKSSVPTSSQEVETNAIIPRVQLSKADKHVGSLDSISKTRIASKTHKEAINPSPPHSPTEKSSANPSLTGLEIILANEKFPSQIISSNRPFKLRLVMDLSGSAALQPDHINYNALVSAQNLHDRRNQIIGQSNGVFKPTEQTTLNLEGRPISPGIYRLSALVTLTDTTLGVTNQQPLRASLSGKVLEVY